MLLRHVAARDGEHLIERGGAVGAHDRCAGSLTPDGPNLMAWPLNNHWDVNFLADQHGQIEQRYRLTTHADGTDEVHAARWSAEQFSVPIVLRDRLRTGESQGRFISLADDQDVLVSAKPAEDGSGLILRLENLQREAQRARVRVHVGTASAAVTSPIEADVRSLEVNGDTVTVPLPGLAFETIRVALA